MEEELREIIKERQAMSPMHSRPQSKRLQDARRSVKLSPSRFGNVTHDESTAEPLIVSGRALKASESEAHIKETPLS